MIRIFYWVEDKMYFDPDAFYQMAKEMSVNLERENIVSQTHLWIEV